ncbi:MAG: DUF1211 domain-containing protein [Faecalicoccus sp.]|nr:DUF1211 domain-containing protein [Faecalicoccus sp.]
MERNRLEAFSDGVLAIVITITVLELKAPVSTGLSDLIGLIPSILVYAMSFIYVGAYWNNHHHIMQAVTYVNTRTMWSNLFFLFWISLLPLATTWMSSDLMAWVPTLAYGIVLLMTAIGYSLLQKSIIKNDKNNEVLKKAVEDGRARTDISAMLYILALILSPFAVHVSQFIYVFLLMIWFVPERRIAHIIHHN